MRRIVMRDLSFDIAVAGLGPAGLAAALALAGLGFRVAAVGQPIADRRDARATALMTPSLTLLENLGVWGDCANQAQPLTGIRVIDATGRLLRAPETTFWAKDAGTGGPNDSFGACIANADLIRALEARVRQNANIFLIETAGITNIEVSSAQANMTLAEGQRIEARLLVGADGRQSPSRTAAGITAITWDYPQAALACTFEHARTHDGLSIEFHRPGGPLTSVPLLSLGGANRSSLVWVEAPDEAKRLAGLDDPAFGRALREQLHGVLGGIGAISPRTVFPLTGLRAEPMARRRTALVGEAAHVMPPIGAQGLNLGMRDVAALHDLLDGAAGNDPGAAEIMDAYARGRQMDVWSRSTAVDLLNRSLLSAQLPVQALRGFGLHLLAGVAPLRRALMRQGLATGGVPPRLMRAKTQPAV
jgi:2-octaprenyl-6-methoxyphenol hydroxylase